MKIDLNRTGKTKLSDNELIIFDAIFDLSCSIDQLKRKGFDERFNFPYKHSLSDKSLIVCLENLQSQKLVRIKEVKENKSTKSFVELTAKGGKVWEIEREPVWEKYCEGWAYMPFREENRLLLEVVSPSRQTLSEYLKISIEINLFGVGKDCKIEFTSEKRKFIVGINWKRFPELHYATFTGNYIEKIPTEKEWNYFYNNLSWWGNIHELNILKEQIS